MIICRNSHFIFEFNVFENKPDRLFFCKPIIIFINVNKILKVFASENCDFDGHLFTIFLFFQNRALLSLKFYF